ncbi:MAG TPA: SDR family NAD(P)-dependent oxidoreductase [Rudaea sp.]|nr:SDR family NAD(P)-dependent oxidoreductase [Rudaea sp.]
MAIAGKFAALPAGWIAATDRLGGRVVLITGASGGLGRATALAAAGAGASVVLLGRKVRALEKVYDEISAIDGAAEPAMYPLDLSGATPADYAELAERIEQQCGRLDGLVHAAAHFDELQPAVDIEPEKWLRCLQVNVTAPYLLTQACVALMRKATDASVVFVLDDPQRMGKAYWGGYGVAKHALAGLVSILHEEWENTTVRVHAVVPPPMRTALRRSAYYGENTMQLPLPDASAEAVVHLLGPGAMPLRGRILDLRVAPSSMAEPVA